MHRPYALQMAHMTLQAGHEDQFEKFHRSGRLMVPLRSVALASMCGTIFASIGRHWSLRPTEVTPLHVKPGGPCFIAVCSLLLLGREGRISCIGHADCLARSGLQNHIACINHAARLRMHQLFHVLSMARLLVGP